MKKIAFGFLLFIFALGVVQPVYAHGGQPRLEINVDHINPGAVVDVRGVEFAYEEMVTLTLIGSQAEIMLGEIPANVEGEFTHIVVLPSDLAEGTYYFRGTTTHHWVLSPALAVQGSSILSEGGGQGPRDEDDGLLAPMPTFAPAAPTLSIPQAPVVAAPASDWNPNILIIFVLFVLGIVVVLGLKRKTLR